MAPGNRGYYKSMQKNVLPAEVLSEGKVVCKALPAVGMSLTTSAVGGSGYTMKKHCVVNKTWRIMRLTAIFLLASGLSLSAHTVSQTVTFTGTNVPLQTVLSAVEEQTGYRVAYNQQLLISTKPVTISATKAPLSTFLNNALQDQALGFTLEGRNIFLFAKTGADSKSAAILPPPPITVRGRIADEKGAPIIATVIIKGTGTGATSNTDGYFELKSIENDAVLLITGINIEPQEIPVSGRTSINIIAKLKISAQDEVIISGGYYQTSNREKTGSIVKIGAKDLERQPVTSPLLALQGRVAGLEILPNSGTPGTALNIKIRGQNSIRTRAVSGIEGNLPLIIIDGIPVSSEAVFYDGGSGAITNGGFDPLSGISVESIENIQVLKDADATAIYGSRGANGVILITTKNRVAASKVGIEGSIYQGFGKIVNKFDNLLSREEYLEMRKEAIANDGSDAEQYLQDPIFGPLFFPDILFWDTTRNTDWQEKLLNQTSSITNANIGLTGSSDQTSFSFRTGYNKETSIYPGDFSSKKYNVDLGVTHRSKDLKFFTSILAKYGVHENNLFAGQGYLSQLLSSSPVLPELYNSDGSLNWSPGPFDIPLFNNPLAGLLQTQYTKNENVLFNIALDYKILGNLRAKVNMGYNSIAFDVLKKIPYSSLSPVNQYPSNVTRTESQSTRRTLNIEPQITYAKLMNRHDISVLIGATFQDSKERAGIVTGSGFVADALLGSLAAAPVITATASDGNYRFASVFSRIGYQFDNKYLLNLTYRRDGSSRFGTGNRWGNFGAIGAAWVFSKEKFFYDNIGFLSFGKVRSSYGTTGNDQISDGAYLGTYSVPFGYYHNNAVLTPTGLLNPDYAWETTKKFEVALEAAFLGNRIEMEVARFSNVSSNQLVQYQLPGIVGYPTVLENFPAVVTNNGWEFMISSVNINTGIFKWRTSLNVSRLINKLKEYEGLESSPYWYFYKVGEPLTLFRGYSWTGVDPQTGIHTFKDVNNDGVINFSDQDLCAALITKYFGGITNTFQFKQFELNFLLQFAERAASVVYFGAPGGANNQPKSVLNRWQKPGDITNVQRYTSGFLSELIDSYFFYTISDASVRDISYCRLKTLSLSYAFTNKLLNKIHASGASIFLQGHNLLTITDFDGWDPETYYNAPPTRMLSAGVNFKF